MQEVIVVVSGGVADVIESPEDVKVTIRDYDIETEDNESRLKTDKHGDKYVEMIF